MPLNYKTQISLIQNNPCIYFMKSWQACKYKFLKNHLDSKVLSTLQTIQICLHFPAQSTLSDKHDPIEFVSTSDSRFKERLLFGCNEEDVGWKVAGPYPGAGKSFISRSLQ